MIKRTAPSPEGISEDMRKLKILSKRPASSLMPSFCSEASLACIYPEWRRVPSHLDWFAGLNAEAEGQFLKAGLKLVDAVLQDLLPLPRG